jgi:hypothetical protein
LLATAANAEKSAMGMATCFACTVNSIMSSMDDFTAAPTTANAADAAMPTAVNALWNDSAALSASRYAWRENLLDVRPARSIPCSNRPVLAIRSTVSDPRLLLANGVYSLEGF